MPHSPTGACGLLDKHPKLSARDALHVAVKNSNLTLLVSIDRDFDSLKIPKRFEPTDVLELLR